MAAMSEGVAEETPVPKLIQFVVAWRLFTIARDADLVLPDLVAHDPDQFIAVRGAVDDRDQLQRHPAEFNRAMEPGCGDGVAVRGIEACNRVNLRPVAQTAYAGGFGGKRNDPGDEHVPQVGERIDRIGLAQPIYAFRE